MNIDAELSSETPLHTWVHKDELRADFRSRLATLSTLPAADADFDLDRYKFARAGSRQTSTAVHARSRYDQESMESDSVPPLTRGNSVASSRSASSTDMASIVDGGYVLESEDGILTLPVHLRPHADLACPFQVLECESSFSDIVEFKIHVFSHFRGHPLPHYAPCFLCGQVFFQTPEDDDSLAWNNMLTHMAYDHYRTNQEVFVNRPEITVMRYMWNRGIISDAEFREVQSEASETPSPTARGEQDDSRQVPEAPMPPSAPIPTEITQHLDQSPAARNRPYVVFAGRRQDRRQRDRSSLRARVRGNL